MKSRDLFNIGMILLCSLILAAIYDNITFKQNCSGYLKRAAVSNNVSTAAKELGEAIHYLEYKGITTGYTSVLYRTPADDIGFWYRNLKESHNELLSLPDSASVLEKSNVLLKLRESLMTSVEGRDTVLSPPGISRYPNNAIYTLLFAISLILISIGILKT